jgi:hypothetical protein
MSLPSALSFGFEFGVVFQGFYFEFLFVYLATPS